MIAHSYIRQCAYIYSICVFMCIEELHLFRVPCLVMSSVCRTFLRIRHLVCVVIVRVSNDSIACLCRA